MCENGATKRVNKEKGPRHDCFLPMGTILLTFTMCRKWEFCNASQINFIKQFYKLAYNVC